VHVLCLLGRQHPLGMQDLLAVLALELELELLLPNLILQLADLELVLLKFRSVWWQWHCVLSAWVHLLRMVAREGERRRTEHAVSSEAHVHAWLCELHLGGGAHWESPR